MHNCEILVWFACSMNLVCHGSEVRIEGLETLDYLDNLRQRERFTEQGDAITFESEVIIFKLRSFFDHRYGFCSLNIMMIQGLSPNEISS